MPFNFSSPEYFSHHRTRKNRVSPDSRASPAHINSPLDVATYTGHVTGETFLNFVNTTLAPCLLPFDGFNPRSVIILGKNSTTSLL